ncbi:MAG TPA: hypothetical protein IAC03_01955 [Candidatus Coprenecus pullistercoris]|nr:hypothetical protein [Candidatus Coprenecus pullistercoris]
MNRHTDHIDTDTLAKYFLNCLPREEETAVQEHLCSCPECSARLEALRKLRGAMSDDSGQRRPGVLFRVLRSGWTKAAAAVIIVAGIGFLTARSVRDRSGIVEHSLNPGMENKDNILSVDTFDKADSAYYKEKYGEDFKL